MTTLLSVSLENHPGSLAEVCEALAEANINVEAIEAEAQGDFAQARLLVNDHVAAARLLRSKGYDVVAAPVIDLNLPNKPGELARVTRALASAKLNIVSIFGTTSTKSGEGRILVRLPDVDAAKKVLGLAKSH